MKIPTQQRRYDERSEEFSCASHKYETKYSFCCYLLQIIFKEGGSN